MSKDKAKHGEWVGAIDAPLTDLLRSGARALIQQAIEAELQAFLGDYAKVTDLRGRQNRGPQWVFAGAGDRQLRGSRSGKNSRGAGSFRRRHQIQLVAGAAVCAQGQARGGGIAVVVFAASQRRHAGGAVDAAGRRGQRLVTGRGQSLESAVGRRLPSLESAAAIPNLNPC